VKSRSCERKTTSTDILLLTALEEEGAAVEAAMPRVGMHRVLKRPNYDVFELCDGGSRITCARITLGGIGRLESAVSATIACIKFQPKFVLLVGIAGGFREHRWGLRNSQVNLGDILIADYLFDLDTRRISAIDDIGVIPKTFKLRDPELRIVRAVSGSSWEKMIPAQLREHSRLQVHIGPMISGDVLLASDECPSIARLCKTAMHTGPGPIGIEMEGAGVALAVDHYNVGTGFLMIRGVSDFADRSKKIDEVKGRKLATYTAANFAVEVIRSQELRSFLHQHDRVSELIPVPLLLESKPLRWRDTHSHSPTSAIHPDVEAVSVRRHNYGALT